MGSIDWANANGAVANVEQSCWAFYNENAKTHLAPHTVFAYTGSTLDRKCTCALQYNIPELDGIASK